MKAGFLSGYRTYVLAGVAIITAVAGFATGDLSLTETLNQVWAGGVAATLRAGIAAQG